MQKLALPLEVRLPRVRDIPLDDMIDTFRLRARSDCAPSGGATVVKNGSSRSGYRSTLRYYDCDATNVKVAGSFFFYRLADKPSFEKIEEELIKAEDWKQGDDLYHIHDAICTLDMEKEAETGAWIITLDLPGGYYLYRYMVSYDGGRHYDKITDPENEPWINAVGAHQVLSQFYVPYDRDRQDPQDNFTYCAPVENGADAGTLYYESYYGVGGAFMSAMVYLPATYKPDAATPYKVLYLTHDEDWFYQGHLLNITDRLIREGKVEPFILVGMNNMRLHWNLDAINENLTEYLIPIIEEKYHIGKTRNDRAFAGLSMGAMAASHILFKNPDMFSSFAILSGGDNTYDMNLVDVDKINTTRIMLGMGTYDFANQTKEEIDRRTAEGKEAAVQIAGSMFLYTFCQPLMISEFKRLGIRYDYYEVNGGHDWFIWTELTHTFITKYMFDSTK